MTMFRVSAALVCMAALFGANQADAQSVRVQGQVQVQPNNGYGQPPPGYGQQQQPQQYQQQPQYYQQPQQPQQPQVQYVTETSSIKALWIPGLVLFGASWILGGSLGLISFDQSYSDWMWVPLIGPWVALGFSNNEDEDTLSVVSGLVQTVGLAMFVLGLSLQRSYQVAVYALDDSERSPELSLSFLPAAGGGQLGATLTHF